MSECEGLILQLCVYSISLLTILQAIGFALSVWMIFFFFFPFIPGINWIPLIFHKMRLSLV